MWSHHLSAQKENIENIKKIWALCDLICLLVNKEWIQRNQTTEIMKLLDKGGKKQWNIDTNKRRNETPQVTKQGWMIKLRMRKESQKQTETKTPKAHNNTTCKTIKNLIFPLFLGGTLNWEPGWSSTQTCFSGRLEFMIYLCFFSHNSGLFLQHRTQTQEKARKQTKWEN